MTDLAEETQTLTQPHGLEVIPLTLKSPFTRLDLHLLVGEEILEAAGLCPSPYLLPLPSLSSWQILAYQHFKEAQGLRS